MSRSNAELAVEVIARYGYLVFAYQEEVRIGGIIDCNDVEAAQVLGQPFVVIGETTEAEYEEHQEFMQELGSFDADTDSKEWPHYYRVTTD